MAGQHSLKARVISKVGLLVATYSGRKDTGDGHILIAASLPAFGGILPLF